MYSTFPGNIILSVRQEPFFEFLVCHDRGLNLVPRGIGEHSTHNFNGPVVYIYIYIYIYMEKIRKNK